MKFPTFASYLAAREGVLAPDKPPVAGLPRFNATGLTNDQRQRLKVKPVPKPGPVVPPVVPPALIPRNLSPSDVAGSATRWVNRVGARELTKTGPA